MILTPYEKAIYFPRLTVTDSDEIEGLCRVTQAFCESQYGANRPLEVHDREDIVNPAGCRSRLLTPVVSVTKIEGRGFTGEDNWGRVFAPLDWRELEVGSYSYEANGLLVTRLAYPELRITYQAGWDFGAINPEPEVFTIKAIAGQVLVYFGENYGGRLNSYLSNPISATAESWNFVQADEYLKAIVRPLKGYGVSYA